MDIPFDMLLMVDYFEMKIIGLLISKIRIMLFFDHDPYFSSNQSIR